MSGTFESDGAQNRSSSDLGAALNRASSDLGATLNPLAVPNATGGNLQFNEVGSPHRISRASSTEDVESDRSASLDMSLSGRIKREVLMLLHFSMLAAGTIGPGTVIVCSKSGADFGLKLIWSLVLASFVAYVLQEGSARLSIVSGFNLGQAMRVHLCSEDAVAQIPAVCFLVAVGILVGNCAYECNNFVGATAALYALEAPETAVARVFLTLMTGVLTIGTLFYGDVDLVSRVLGSVVIFMVCLFMVSVLEIGVDAKSFGSGLVPNFPPDGGSVTALAMVSTTAIPFNCFLASTAAEGFDLNSMKRGIACSTVLAGLLSFFIVVTGTGVGDADDYDDDDSSDFTIEDLTSTLKRTEGKSAAYGFGFGLYAAAYSSAISVALGASLTCQSLLGRQPEVPAKSQRPQLLSDQQRRQDDSHSQQDQQGGSSGGQVQSPVKPASRLAAEPGAPVSDEVGEEPDSWHEKGTYFRGIIALLVLISFVVGASGADTIEVIFTAQVVNGFLLPIIALCLFVCLNDERLMRARPTTLVDNCCLSFVVAATIFLACDTLFGALVPAASDDDIFVASVVAMFVLMLPILWYVWRQVKNRDGTPYVNADGSTAPQSPTAHNDEFRGGSSHSSAMRSDV